MTIDARAGAPPPAVEAVPVAAGQVEHRAEETILQAAQVDAWEDEGGTTAGRRPVSLRK